MGPSPHGEGGLKYGEPLCFSQNDVSLPTRGGWIEIKLCMAWRSEAAGPSPHGEGGASHRPPIPQPDCRLGVNTVQLCRERDISINKLCTMSGVTQSTVNNIVSGRNKSVTISTIKKLCDGLDMPIEDFFKSDLFKGLEQELK